MLVSLKPVSQPTSDQDEGVGNERGSGELGQIADHGQRKEENELAENEGADRDAPLAVADGQEERLQVLRDEYRVGGDEADLGHSDREQNGLAHVVAIQDSSDIYCVR